MTIEERIVELLRANDKQLNLLGITILETLPEEKWIPLLRLGFTRHMTSMDGKRLPYIVQNWIIEPPSITLYPNIWRKFPYGEDKDPSTV